MLSESLLTASCALHARLAVVETAYVCRGCCLQSYGGTPEQAGYLEVCVRSDYESKAWMVALNLAEGLALRLLLATVESRRRQRARVAIKVELQTSNIPAVRTVQATCVFGPTIL